jgi:hypothetical protein
MSEENCGHISIAEYEAFDECRDCLRRWPKKDAPVSDDTDKAARAAYKEWRDELRFQPRDDFAAFKASMEAGASHALIRPLSEEEAIQMGTEINQAFADHRGSPTGTELARAAYSALQRMRTKG